MSETAVCTVDLLRVNRPVPAMQTCTAPDPNQVALDIVFEVAKVDFASCPGLVLAPTARELGRLGYSQSLRGLRAMVSVNTSLTGTTCRAESKD